MILKIFAVHDSAVMAYMQPFFLRARGEAIRAFEGLVNDPNTAVNKKPSDYTLFELGEFDDSKGLVTSSEPLSLGNGVEFYRSGQAA